MFNSGKSADELIKEITDEVDVATPTSEQTLVDELNGLERMLYSEIIKEQAVITPVFPPLIEDDTPDDLPSWDL